MTKPIENHRTNLVGVRFKPGMAFPFFSTPLHKITDLQVDFAEFEGHQANVLLNQLIDINSTPKQIALLNKVFLKKLATLSAVERQVSQALNIIQKTNGRCTVKQISESVGWSRQHFARKCLCYTGLPPKFLSQIVRVHNVINQYKKGTSHDWIQLSHYGGYFDQSHMINEFKKITGLTPIEFLGTK